MRILVYPSYCEWTFGLFPVSTMLLWTPLHMGSLHGLPLDTGVELLVPGLRGSSFILPLIRVGKSYSTFPFPENFNFCASAPVVPALILSSVFLCSCHVISSGSSFSTWVSPSSCSKQWFPLSRSHFSITQVGNVFGVFWEFSCKFAQNGEHTAFSCEAL